MKNRLESTARTVHDIIFALEAVTNDTPLEVGINGPTYITSSGTYTWTAYPSGEDGAVSYDWDYQPAGSSTWYDGGTQQSFSRDLYRYNSDFRLRVEVVSGNETDSRTLYVTVNIY